MGVFGVFAYTIAVGFVTAGLIGSLYQLLTSKPVAFELLHRSGSAAILGVLTLVVAGPAVIMRNAIRGRLLEDRPGHWLAISTVLSAAWSFLQGVFILSFVVSATTGGMA
ncbi:MAG: DUF6949 family protein [Hyphomicrobiales bacterium]